MQSQIPRTDDQLNRSGTMPYLPVDVMFHTNWWNKNLGVVFTEDFFFDPEVRVRAHRQMRQCLWDRFGDIGLGVNDPDDAPVVGPTLLGTGYFIQEILGCDVRYQESGNPLVLCRNMTDTEIMDLKVPEIIEETAPMRRLIRLMDEFERRFGYLAGVVPMHSVVNVSLDLRGQRYFIDLLEIQEIVDHLHEVIAGTIVKVGRQLSPMGIHHCGTNAELFAGHYAAAGAASLHVGVGSDVRRCRDAFPDGWLYLRMDPVSMKGSSAGETRDTLISPLEEHGDPLDRVAITINNIDHGTPDECIRAVFETLKEKRGSHPDGLRSSYEHC